MKLSHRIFGYRASYFDVFIMGFALETGDVFGNWIGFVVLLVLAGISGAISYKVNGGGPPAPTTDGGAT